MKLAITHEFQALEIFMMKFKQFQKGSSLFKNFSQNNTTLKNWLG